MIKPSKADLRISGKLWVKSNGVFLETIMLVNITKNETMEAKNKSSAKVMYRKVIFKAEPMVDQNRMAESAKR